VPSGAFLLAHLAWGKDAEYDVKGKETQPV
jgi:hypothetical protein